MRRRSVLVAYDCIFPATKGGAERWYARLAADAAAGGWAVTYATRTQWPVGDVPQIDGVIVAGMGGSGDLYTTEGRRRILPPVRYGVAIFWFLLRRRRSFDVVHLASFPYFSLIGARAALIGSGTPVFVDWHEVWSRAYWRAYVGTLGGTIGFAVQAACLRLPHASFTTGRRIATRLGRLGVRGEVVVLPGLLSPAGVPWVDRHPADPTEVLFVGRLIPEKRAPLAVDAIGAAARRSPGLSGRIIGDGPDGERMRRAIASAPDVAIDACGFVAEEELRSAISEALCLLVCSEREGWGLVAAEAIAVGTPVVVVDAPDSLAAERVVHGVTGLVVDGSVDALADAIIEVRARGSALRRSTSRWFAEHGGDWEIARSTAMVVSAWTQRVDER